MQHSKLMELLRQMPSRRLNGFGDFLRSPYFNKNKDYVAYFQLLKSCAPEFSSPQLAKDALCKAWNLSERDLAYRTSELVQLLETYLAVADFLEHPLEQQLRLMQTFADLGLDKHYESARRKAYKLLEALPHRDGLYFQNAYLIKATENRYSEQYERTYREALQRAANALDDAYLTEKLRYCLEMVNATAVLDIRYDLNLGEEVIVWALSRGEHLPMSARLFCSALLMLKHPEEEVHFQQLRALLAEHETVLPPGQVKSLYGYLLNFCTRRINLYRDKAYYGHFLEINEILLQKGMLLDEEGCLPPWRFNNLVTTGLRTGRLEWARQFMHDYKKFLPEAFRENIFNFNLAHVLYYQKAYDKAQVILNQLDLRDLLLAVAAKNLLAKIYYETGQTELLLSFLEAYRIYMHRQDLAKPQLKYQVRNFIDATRKLAKIPPFEVHKKQHLHQNLPQPADVMEWEWLYEMSTT